MKKITSDFSVGLFLMAGFFAFVYLSLQLGEFSIFSLEKNYRIQAEFANVSGLKLGAAVEIGGVNVGRVSKITLNQDDMAEVVMLISKDVIIGEDAVASIRTAGMIGDKYVKITQDGGGGEPLGDMGTIFETESAIDLEKLISNYIFGDLK